MGQIPLRVKQATAAAIAASTSVGYSGRIVEASDSDFYVIQDGATPTNELDKIPTVVISAGGDLDDVLTVTGSTEKTIIVDKANTVLTQDVPANITLEFAKGASIANPASPETVNISGVIKADPYQDIFGTATQGNLTLNLKKGSTLIVPTGWFGSVPDMVAGGTSITTPGTDSGAAILQAKESSLDILALWIPPGKTTASGATGYRTTVQIKAEADGADENGGTALRFKGFKILGGNLMDPNSKTLVYGDMDDGCIINIQGSRTGIISNFSVYGKNRAPQELETLGQTVTGTVSITNGTSAVSGSGTAFDDEFQVGQKITIPNDDGVQEHLTITVITSATAMTVSETYGATSATGVTAKKYRKFIENYVTDGIDTGVKTALTGIGVDYNDLTGLDTNYGSKNVTVKNCLVRYCYVAYGHDVGGNVQGDTVRYQNIKAEHNAIDIVCGGTQSRSVEINGFEFDFSHTWFDNVTHGEAGGSFFGFYYGQLTNHYQWFNSTTAFGGDMIVRNVFGEFNGRIGVIGGANNGNVLTISGDQSKWDPLVFKADIEFIDALTPVVFENHSFRMNDLNLFFFSNSKRTTLRTCKFTSDAGIPIIIGDQLTPNKIRLENCVRFDNSSDYREDLDSTIVIPKADAGDYHEIQWWHRQIIQEGVDENPTLRIIQRSRTTIFDATSMSGNHDWSTTAGSDVMTLTSGAQSCKTGTPGTLVSMADVNGNSVMMGEVTAMDYGTNKATVTPLWHEWGFEATQGTVYIYLTHYHKIGGVLGDITAGTAALTVPDDSIFDVNDIVHLPIDGEIRRVTAKPGSNVLTLHSNATTTHIDANISDAT